MIAEWLQELEQLIIEFGKNKNIDSCELWEGLTNLAYDNYSQIVEGDTTDET